MWGAVSKPPTCPNFQTRVSQLGPFHWPGLEMACRGSPITQLRELPRARKVFGLSSLAVSSPQSDAGHFECNA
jgi:hypothetical protein